MLSFNIIILTRLDFKIRHSLRLPNLVEVRAPLNVDKKMALSFAVSHQVRTPKSEIMSGACFLSFASPIHQPDKTDGKEMSEGLELK